MGTSKLQYPSIPRISQRFEEIMADMFHNINGITQIYICGPPSMGNSLVKTMDRLSVPKEKYTIL